MIGIIVMKIARSVRDRRDDAEEERKLDEAATHRDWDRLLAVAARRVKWGMVTGEERHVDAVHFVGPTSDMGLLSKEKIDRERRIRPE